jgi:uncharacterized membrane protein (DUF106 family)
MMFEFVTALIAPLMATKPVLSLLIVSSAMTAIVVVMTRLMINKKVVGEIKDKMENIREQLTAAQKAGNTEEANKHMADMMKVNSEYMRQTFKALMASIIVLALFVPFLKQSYEGMAVVTMPLTVPVLGSSLNWVYWYILVSLAMGYLLRKLLEVD